MKYARKIINYHRIRTLKGANHPLMYIKRRRCILLGVFKCSNQISSRHLHDIYVWK